MRSLFLLLLVLVPTIGNGQRIESAIAKYAENGKMISVADLASLSDCPIRTVTGKVASVKVEGSRVNILLKEKKVQNTITIPLDRLAADDRDPFFRDLVKKKMPLRIAAYVCEPDASITAFSVDRVY